MVNSQVQTITRDGNKKVGRNRFSVEFNSAEAANAFILDPLLASKNFEASFPRSTSPLCEYCQGCAYSPRVGRIRQGCGASFWMWDKIESLKIKPQTPETRTN